MQVMQIHHEIVERRKNGETYRAIAESLGIGHSLVQYIETHPDYAPSKKVRAILNIEPGSDLVYTRLRRSTLNYVAELYGFPNWSAYETEVVHQYNKIYAIMD